jgi:hypothetical protein
MKYLPKVIFALISISLVSPAMAETWDCTWKILSRDEKGVSGRSRIEVSGDKLSWLLPPSPGAREWSSFPYEVLDDNSAGLVSISHSSHVDSQAGPIIGAQLIALNKANGNFRMGSVTAEITDDRLAGRCRKKSSGAPSH